MSASAFVPGAAFHAALAKFRTRLSAQELEIFRGTTYDGLRHEILRIQREQEKTKGMMNLSRIQSFLEAMDNFGKVIEVFLNVADAVAFVWGPIKFLLLIASNWADSFEALLEAYEHIGEQLPMLTEYESLFRNNLPLLHALESMYMDILAFHQQALRFFTTGKVWKKLFKAMWKDFDSHFKGILDSLRRHKELIESRADIAQYRRYQEDMLVLKTNIETMLEEAQRKKEHAVKEWLGTGRRTHSSTDSDGDSQTQADHMTFLAVRDEYPETGGWILQNELIVNWLSAAVPTTPLLWMNGIPGAGKTILASIIIEDCKKKNGFATSYFYCSYRGSCSSTAVAVFKGLLGQIVAQFPYLVPHCYSRYLTDRDPTLRSLALAKTLLKDYCQTVPTQYLIIDGLDECEPVERKQILEFLVDLASECNADEPGSLRVLFVSQDFADIRKALHSVGKGRIAPKTISLSATDNETDIQVYTGRLTARLKTTFDLNDAQEKYVRCLTVARAGGMFLYAKLVLTNLLNVLNRERLLYEIQEERFPRELEDAYERILSRIKRTCSRDGWQQVKKLLGWMVCAKRQLTWREMQVALSLDFDSQEVRYDDRRLRVHIYDLCGSLVYRSGDSVQLVHSTARNCTGDIHETSVECELASMCLQYLTFPCFDTSEELDDSILRRYALDGMLGFQDYAVAKWFHHVNAFIDGGNDFLNSHLEVTTLLQQMTVALEDFCSFYHEEAWDTNVPEPCIERCKVFEGQDFYDNLVALSGHIYTFYIKGFEGRHAISLKQLAMALKRNHNALEELPNDLNQSELATYRQFYNDEYRFKCNRITCIYFSDGFKDPKARMRHLDLHERPFQCEVTNCVAAELGFCNAKDLEKHKRSYHPDISDLAETFKATVPAPSKWQWSCSICGQCFTRNLARKDHEKSHRGIREHVCPECGKAFTRKYDLTRHQKIHDRRTR